LFKKVILCRYSEQHPLGHQAFNLLDQDQVQAWVQDAGSHVSTFLP